jgi:hypothetical protein
MTISKKRRWKKLVKKLTYFDNEYEYDMYNNYKCDASV